MNEFILTYWIGDPADRDFHLVKADRVATLRILGSILMREAGSIKQVEIIGPDRIVWTCNARGNWVHKAVQP